MKCEYNAEEKLTDCGFRVTEKRVKLLELLAKAERPLSLEEIQKKVGKIMDRTTLYRALESLLEKKIIKTVDFGDKDDRYELNDENRHHHHIICQQCKKIEEIEDCAVEDSLLNFAKKSKQFSSIDNHSLEFFGICKDCSKKL
jgi:Fe2+ or Zn2+ uptake regulation protein